MAAQESKLTLKDAVCIVMMMLTCVIMVFLQFNYINIPCVLITMMFIISILSIIIRIFLWKAEWFVVGFDKKVVIYHEEKIHEKVKENEGR